METQNNLVSKIGSGVF